MSLISHLLWKFFTAFTGYWTHTVFGYITGSNQSLYLLYHMSLRTSVHEILGIFDTQKFIHRCLMQCLQQPFLPVLILQFLLLVWHFVLPELILQLCCYCFSLAQCKYYRISEICPVGWGCRIHRLLLCRGGKTPPPTGILVMTLNNLMVRFH